MFVSPDVPDPVVGDPVRLRQIITNLAGNSIKFTSHGGITLTVTEASREGEEVMLSMSVRDTGIGISREAREHVFDPFVQADSSTTRKFGGSGLGLAIVKQLVDMMGGTISLTSEPGHGSEFSFTARFRLASEQEFARRNRVEESPAEAPPTAAGRSLSVLVAEDVELNQVIVARFLEMLGHRPTVVTNGREALDTWCEGGFDLVLMDVQMPQMDGLAATRAIREQERSRGGHIPIIAMTAHVMSEDVAHCLEAGMDGQLNKPLKRADLEKALENLFKA
jgi:CheY-like chemotaxis protein